MSTLERCAEVLLQNKAIQSRSYDCFRAKYYEIECFNRTQVFRIREMSDEITRRKLYYSKLLSEHGYLADTLNGCTLRFEAFQNVLSQEKSSSNQIQQALLIFLSDLSDYPSDLHKLTEVITTHHALKKKLEDFQLVLFSITGCIKSRSCWVTLFFFIQRFIVCHSYLLFETYRRLWKMCISVASEIEVREEARLKITSQIGYLIEVQNSALHHKTIVSKQIKDSENNLSILKDRLFAVCLRNSCNEDIECPQNLFLEDVFNQYFSLALDQIPKNTLLRNQSKSTFAFWKSSRDFVSDIALNSSDQRINIQKSTSPILETKVSSDMMSSMKAISYEVALLSCYNFRNSLKFIHHGKEILSNTEQQISFYKGLFHDLKIFLEYCHRKWGTERMRLSQEFETLKMLEANTKQQVIISPSGIYKGNILDNLKEFTRIIHEEALLRRVVNEIEVRSRLGLEKNILDELRQFSISLKIGTDIISTAPLIRSKKFRQPWQRKTQISTVQPLKRSREDMRETVRKLRFHKRNGSNKTTIDSASTLSIFCDANNANSLCVTPSREPYLTSLSLKSVVSPCQSPANICFTTNIDFSQQRLDLPPIEEADDIGSSTAYFKEFVADHYSPYPFSNSHIPSISSSNKNISQLHDVLSYQEHESICRNSNHKHGRISVIPSPSPLNPRSSIVKGFRFSRNVELVECLKPISEHKKEYANPSKISPPLIPFFNSLQTNNDTMLLRDSSHSSDINRFFVSDHSKWRPKRFVRFVNNNTPNKVSRRIRNCTTMETKIFKQECGEYEDQALVTRFRRGKKLVAS